MTEHSFRSRLRNVGLRHFSRLYDIYSEWVRKRLPDHMIVCQGPGFSMEIFPPRESVIGRAIYRTGVWEPEMTAISQEKIRPGWHILDIGAHIGYYTLLFAKQTGPEGRIIAFEPMPKERGLLEKNVGLNQFKNVQVFPYALSDHRGVAIMEPDCKGQMIPDAQQSDHTVEMVPLDELWPNLGCSRLDLVKIDVEGAKMGVLKGMVNVLKQYRPNLLIEIHPVQLQAFHSSAQEVMTWLRENFGYDFIPVDADTLDIQQENMTLWGSVPSVA